MISRNSFFNLQKEDFKRRLWSVALSLLVFFLLGPVLLALTIEGYSDSTNIYVTRAYILQSMAPGYALHFFITIIGALICAYSGFFYLHSKKKVDFYHSMPVKRERFFAVQFVDGVLLYLIPYVFNMFLCYIVLFAKSYMGMDVFINSLQALGMNLLYFLLIYTITIIAVMLTGNGVVSILGTCVFLAYGPLLMLVRSMYYSSFFDTFIEKNLSERNILVFLSPIGKYIQRTIQLLRGDTDGFGRSIFFTMVVILLLVALALFLYKKRPSEAAGKAMAFELAKPIIKFLMLVPVTLAGGLIFMQVSSMNTDGWLIFGLILVFIVFGGIVEIIYQFDLKKAFAHKKGLAAAAGTIILIVCIFRFDVFHYDTYLPEKDKVESMSIWISGLDSDKGYVQINEDGLTYDYYYNNFDYQQKYMRMKSFDAAYEIAKLGIQGIDEEQSADAVGNYSVQVAYQLKNGKKVTRNYQFVQDNDFSLLSELYTNKEFKTGYYPIYQWKSASISSVSANTFLEEKRLTLTKEEIDNLLDIYRNELTSLSLKDIQANKPIATLNLKFTNNREFDYFILPNFTETLKFLEAHGFKADGAINAEQVKKVIVYDRTKGYDSAKEVYEKEQSYNGEENIYVYEEKTKIQEILDKAIPSNYLNSYSIMFKPEYNLEVNIVLGVDEYGNETYVYSYFSKDNIPDFISKDIGYNPESGKN
ncbi:DUF6449 domain-containing protein [Anaerocolumna sp. AGMB13020]|uniref:DUF6449 domain-containing protein n=1 Tax=Anaerocolumna sp. AGMB13020 TaxID=3081750 RepID=UPI0029538F13|nr:DUF6449 domain-containing protein [Anaerocolumna sp. AGMB13020]WOO37560.1 DUF6449 domain-containing protein [Anaerocolumna sp. AGMB13020]